MTKSKAETVRQGDVVLYAGQRYTVTAIGEVDGPKPPYFTICQNPISREIQVTYLLCQPTRSARP